ncbi:MAG: CHAT domain-containing protein [Saprospiraceae bacterium]
MTSNNVESNLRWLIAGDKTNIALEHLLDVLKNRDQELYNKVLMQSTLWQSAKKEYNVGRLDSKEWDMTRNRVNHALLDIISNINARPDDSDIRKKTADAISQTAAASGSIWLGSGAVSISGGDVSFILNSKTGKNGHLEDVQGSVPSEKKRVLFVSANPNDVEPLRFDKEIKAIKQALARSNSIEFVAEQAVRPEELLRLMETHKPQIVHVSAHNSQVKGILFENEHGKAYSISGEILASFFELINAWEEVVECVVLNACNSAAQAEDIAPYVQCAIGMQDFLPDEAAIAFAEGFYESIALSEGYNQAWHSGALRLKLLGTQRNTSSKTPLYDVPKIFSVREVLALA